MGFITKRLKITRLKLLIAKILYHITTFFIGKKIRIVKRNGINFELDLNEGIDLSLFLFGSFQKHIYNNSLLNFEHDSIIFDVGGNTGTMSLLFAKKSPDGTIHAFEPTNYALNKFERNISLNPQYKENIILNQCFISSSPSAEHNIKAYSSWPIHSNGEKHAIHRGVSKPADDIPAISLDSYCSENDINRLDIIKIDTDGHEYEVLSGSIKTLKKLKPRIIFEVGIYIMNEKKLTFSHYYYYFKDLNYRLYTVKGKEVNENNYTQYIPQWGTTDLIALPI